MKLKINKKKVKDTAEGVTKEVVDKVTFKDWVAQKRCNDEEKTRVRYENAMQKLHILTYDDGTEEYTLTEYKVMRQHLPKNAVHVTGKKGVYFLDLVHPGCECDPEKCTAIDLNLWMMNNDINDALLYKYTSGQVDTKKVITIAVIAIIAIIVVWTIIPR